MGQSCAGEVLHRQGVYGASGGTIGRLVAWSGAGRETAGRGFHVTDLSRNGAGFRLIPDEITRKIRAFFAIRLVDCR